MDNFVNSRLKDNSVTLFITAGCPYCRNASEILKRYIAPPCLQEFDITGLPGVQNYLQETTGQRTGPYIFFGRQYIGGLSELQNMGCNLHTVLQNMSILM